jgi:hypothetical protein
MVFNAPEAALEEINKCFRRNTEFFRKLDEKKYLSIEEGEIDDWIAFYEDHINNLLITIPKYPTKIAVGLAIKIAKDDERIKRLLLVKEERKKMIEEKGNE